MTPAQVRPAHRASRRGGPAAGALLVPIALVAAGVLAYAFLALAARALGPELYGPVALLWACTFLVTVVLFRAVEQTASREIAARVERGEELRPVKRALTRVVALLIGLVFAITAVFWAPITEHLFGGRESFTVALAVGVAFYGIFYLVRGVCGGLGWFTGYAGTLVADGVARLLVAAPLLVVASPGWAAAGIVAAAAAGAAFAPLVGLSRHWRAAVDGTPAPFPVGRALRFGTPVAGMATADQVLVNGAPILVALGGDARAAGIVFAATMLVRAPVFVFQGVAAVLLPKLAAVHAAGDHAGFKRSVVRVAALVGGGMLAFVPVALVAGPWAMGAFYGPGFAASGSDLALLTAGVAFYLVGATVAQGAIARGDVAAGGAAWGIAAAVFVALTFALDGTALHRVSVAFLVGAGLAAALSTFALVRGGRPVPARGAREPEMRGAAA